MPGNVLTLDSLVHRLTTFELSNNDNSMVIIGNAFKSSLTIESLKKGKKRKEESEFEFEDDLDELEALLARKLSRGKGKYKGEFSLICFKSNEVGRFVAKCPNKSKSDRNDKILQLYEEHGLQRQREEVMLHC